MVLKREAPVNYLLAALPPTPAKPAKAERSGSQGVTMLGAAEAGTAAVSGQKQKKSRGEETEPLLEEQVESLGLTPGSGSALPASSRSRGQNPKAGTLVQMLTQALHSKDSALLDEVRHAVLLFSHLTRAPTHSNDTHAHFSHSA